MISHGLIEADDSHGGSWTHWQLPAGECSMFICSVVEQCGVNFFSYFYFTMKYLDCFLIILEHVVYQIFYAYISVQLFGVSKII